MARTAVGTGDQPPDPYGAHVAAQVAAFRRIRAQRRRLTQADAEAIIREEATARGTFIAGHVVRHKARTWLRSPWWPFLHPLKAKREGYTFAWSRGKDDAG